jgi:hemerythrin
MALMNWTSKYSVGVPLMDAQHQKWFGLMNKLHDAMMAGKAKQLQASILAEMVAYTHTHLSQEEALLSRKGYPKLAEHQQKHAAFTAKVEDFHTKFESGTTVLTMEIMDILKQWLNSHVLLEDSQYGAWMNEH